MRAKMSLPAGIVALAFTLDAFAAGTPSMPLPGATPGAEKTTEEIAIEHYNAGLASRDDAWRLERKLAKASAEERTKLDTKIARAFDRSIEELEAAIELEPTMHQAWTSLGYALRRRGEAERSLEAYRRALELRPGYPEALEYRGEAYLALGKLDEARSAHDELRAISPKLADELLGAMRAWIASQRTTEGSVGADRLAELEQWIEAQGRGELPADSSLRKTRDL